MIMGKNILKVEYIERNKLILYKKNSKKHPKEQVEKIKRSIKEFGFNVPILIDSKRNIIAGHGRYLAARELDITPVPCIIKDDLTDDQIKAFRIADNKVAESDWDLDFLKDDIADLQLENYDISLTGFNDEEIGELFPEDKKEIIDDGLVEVEAYERAKNKTKIKLGDIYQLGEHTLMCGDATSKHDVDKLIKDKIDVIITDPPYGLDYEYNSYKDNSGNDHTKFCDSWFDNIKRKSEIMILFTGWKYNSFWQLKNPYDVFYWIARNKQSGGKNSNFRRTEPIFIWGRIKNRFVDDYFDIINEHKQKIDGKPLIGLYTCPKPLKLFYELIQCVNKNESIFDAFGGSGTTLIACEQLNRKCYMMELDPVYCQVIIDRWEKFTGKKSTKL